MNDPSASYQLLRRETAAMLKLDADALSLVEGLQLDLLAMLRLEIDGLQGKVLAGEQVDLDRLATALGMLGKLLPASALASAPPPSETTRFGPDHRARLKQLIERVVMREDPSDPGEVERLRDACEREERTMADEAAGREPEPVPAAPMAPPARPQREEAAPAWWGSAVVLGPWGVR